MGLLSDPPAEFLAAADLLGAGEPDGAWRQQARPQQLPPDGDWFVWLIMAGRGWGKTRTGAEWLAHEAQTSPGDYAVIGRSTQDTKGDLPGGPERPAAGAGAAIRLC